MISYEEFAKVELKVGRVIAAERVEGSEKLLKLRVDLQDDARQIIAGVGKAYDPDTLVGMYIVIVANLEPRMLMGLESQGMLLAADGSDGPVVLQPDREVAPGTKIK